MGGATALVRRYYLYTATLSAGFVYPITTQYQPARGLSYGEVGLVGTVFMTVWVLAEVPTGYLGDLLGRRRLLVGASALNAAVLAGLRVLANPSDGRTPTDGDPRGPPPTEEATGLPPRM